MGGAQYVGTTVWGSWFHVSQTYLEEAPLSGKGAHVGAQCGQHSEKPGIYWPWELQHLSTVWFGGAR